MSNSVSALGGNPDAGYGQAPASQQQDEAKASVLAAEAVVDGEDFGLVIEDSPAGPPLYKMVDRKTGRVVRQHQGDALLSMREAARYAAGDVIKTLA